MRWTALFSQPAVLASLAFLGAPPLQTDGAILSLLPSADTSLMEVAPTNNNGAQAWILSGTTQNTPNTRALLKFDLTPLPTNAVISVARVILSVTREPSDGLVSAPFGLHRMLRFWTEGAQSSATTPGQGAPAQPGETTWSHRSYPTTPWGAPGGAPGVDFVPAQSAFQFVYGEVDSPYIFETTPEIVSDVQGWTRDPASNFGWILICADEGTIFTARRFGSREDPVAPPILDITYIVPPRFEQVYAVANTIHLQFLALPEHTYELQFQTAPNQPWQTLQTYTPTSEPTPVFFEEPMTGSRLFRLKAH